ncbi:hypothetical protein JHK87_043350 [Glycine soja]|nr:hypothetical protein JHK87_043350 [Glycine soja]
MTYRVMFYFSGKTLGDILDVLPREWISEDLMEALMKKGIICVSPTCIAGSLYFPDSDHEL